MRGGEVIRAARGRAGLTQRQLAARLGTPQPVIARWESGDRSPSCRSLTRALRACGFAATVELEPLDANLEELLKEWEQLTPGERLRANRRLLETEAWARKARTVDRRADARR